MKPLPDFIAYLKSLQQKAKESTNSPTEITVELEQYINDILAPDDPPGDVGILRPRYIHRSLANRLLAHPAFFRFGVLEDFGDDNIRLWRKKDWDGQYKVYVAKKEIEAADTIQRIEERERFDRAFKNLLEMGPAYKYNKKLAEDTLRLFIQLASQGDETKKRILTKLDYYDNSPSNP